MERGAVGVKCVRPQPGLKPRPLDLESSTLTMRPPCLGYNSPWSFTFVWFVNRSEIDVDLRTLVYYYGIANTGLEEWKWLFDKFMNTSEASEKSKLMYALAGSRETWILNM